MKLLCVIFGTFVLFSSCSAADDALEAFEHFKSKVQKKCYEKSYSDSQLSIEDAINIVIKEVSKTHFLGEKIDYINLARYFAEKHDIYSLVLLTSMLTEVFPGVNIFKNMSLFTIAYTEVWNSGIKLAYPDIDQDMFNQFASDHLNQSIPEEKKAIIANSIIESLYTEHQIPSLGLIPVIGKLGITLPITIESGFSSGAFRW